MLIEGRSVTTVGGGTGSPTINEALLKTNRVDHINAVAAVFDSGGATGRRRLDSRGQEIAYSDPMRILISLISPSEQNTEKYEAIKSHFNHRDETDTVLGQDIFHHYFNKETGFSDLERYFDLIGVKLYGHVLPSSTEFSHIAFKTQNNRNYIGEHLLDDQRMSMDMVTEMHLDPNVPAFLPAADAIEKAKLIVLSCGSLHGSVLANFLPEGMKEAVSKSNARLLLVTNLVSTRNETHEFLPKDFDRRAEEYTGKHLDGVIVPDMTREKFERTYPDAAYSYSLDHSHFLGWTTEQLRAAEKSGIEIIQHHATKVIPGKNGPVVRHDTDELAKTLEKIIPGSSR